MQETSPREGSPTRVKLEGVEEICFSTFTRKSPKRSCNGGVVEVGGKDGQKGGEEQGEGGDKDGGVREKDEEEEKKKNEKNGEIKDDGEGGKGEKGGDFGGCGGVEGLSPQKRLLVQEFLREIENKTVEFITKLG